MEKKFKYKIIVEGPVTLLKAFGEELDKLGYQRYKAGAGSKYILINFTETFGNNSYAFQDSYGSTSKNIGFYNLPDEWYDVLKRASETEEVIPEYVECIVDYAKNDFDTPNIERGRIVKVDSVKPGGKFYTTSPANEELLRKNYPTDNSNKSNLLGTGYYSFSDFKPSTWEAYEAQQNAPKYKEGQFVYNAGFKNSIPLFITGFNSSTKEYNIIVEDCLAKPIQTYPQKELERRYSPITDEEALQLLKAHYAKQGIVEGAIFETAASCKYKITGFHLIKNFKGTKNFPGLDYGNSQLAITFSTDQYYVTPTTEGFKILLKEVKVAGYPTTKTDIVWGNGMVRIGCETQGKFFTKDSLIAIKDLLSATGFEFIDFTYSPIGRIKLYKKEIEEAINLLN